MPARKNPKKRSTCLRGLFLPVLLLLLASSSYAQDSSLVKKRTRKVIYTGGAVYGVALIGMNELWYKDSPRTNFHFFNDNAEWLQVDKVGHFYGAYHISGVATEAFRWAGQPEKKAYLYGALTGILFQTPIEIMDAYSPDFGASWGDAVANTLGSSFLFGQYLLWDEIRIYPKFSFHRTDYAPLRPQLLGSNFQEELLKDYNGQTYWFSFQGRSFLPSWERLPKWLNLAVGYGAEDMLRARKDQNEAEGFDMYRQWYLSLDLHLDHLHSEKRWVNWLLYLANGIKIPFPALEFSSREGVVFRPLYF